MDEFKRRLTRVSAERSDSPALGLKIGDSAPPTFGLIEDAFRINGATVDVVSDVVEPRRWFVVRTNPKCESKAVSGLSEKGIAAYAPKLKVWRIVRRPKPGRPRKRAVENSLFPGYLFCGFPQPASEDFGMVRDIDGVHSFIAVQGAPLAVSADVVQSIKADESAGLYDETREKPSKFARGDAVVLTHGPFAGYVGHVAHIAAGERIKVLLDFLGSVSGVTIGMDQAESLVSASSFLAGSR